MKRTEGDRIPDRVFHIVERLESRIHELESTILFQLDHGGNPEATRRLHSMLEGRAAYCVWCKRRHLIADGCPAGTPFDQSGNAGKGVFGRSALRRAS